MWSADDQQRDIRAELLAARLLREGDALPEPREEELWLYCLGLLEPAEADWLQTRVVRSETARVRLEEIERAVRAPDESPEGETAPGIGAAAARAWELAGRMIRLTKGDLAAVVAKVGDRLLPLLPPPGPTSLMASPVLGDDSPGVEVVDLDLPGGVEAGISREEDGSVTLDVETPGLTGDVRLRGIPLLPGEATREMTASIAGDAVEFRNVPEGPIELTLPDGTTIRILIVPGS